MATFEGTLKEFDKFIGPTTNKVVTRLGKQLKTTQRSCQNDSLKEFTVDDEYCGKYKSLDAAHFSHKKLDRKSIIKNILNQHFKKDKAYSVDLVKFLQHYEKAHMPLEENLIMLCRQHHVIYDRFNKSTEADELESDEIDEIVLINLKDNQEIDLKTDEIKKLLISQIDYLNSANCNIARISGKEDFFWNFNIKKSNKIGFLICMNQFDRSVTVLQYDFGLEKVGTYKKDKEKVSLIIRYSESEFIDRKTNYSYEIIDFIKLQ